MASRNATTALRELAAHAASLHRLARACAVGAAPFPNVNAPSRNSSDAGMSFVLLVLLALESLDVSTLSQATGAVMPKISRHLAGLRAEGLVRFERERNRHLYAITERVTLRRVGGGGGAADGVSELRLDPPAPPHAPASAAFALTFPADLIDRAALELREIAGVRQVHVEVLIRAAKGIRPRPMPHAAPRR